MAQTNQPPDDVANTVPADPQPSGNQAEADQQAVADPAVLPYQLSAQEYRQQQAVKAMELAAAKQLDFAKNGGRYLVNNQLVDADGKPVKK